MADQAGVDWTQLPGSGAGGKVMREDISQAIAAEDGGADDEILETLPVVGTRAVIASRMMQSAAQTAPVTLTSEVDATELVVLRSRLNADGVPCSYNDLLLTVLARALRTHPRLNASLQGDVINVWKRINVGLAVDSEQGLRVPVVYDADKKGLAEIAQETASLIETVRQGSAVPQGGRRGTFTLTNLGMFGIDAFTPIINLPECAILGVGRIKPQPSVVDGELTVRQKMWLSLTFDHRLIDGGPAARFLQCIAQLIEKPHLLLK
jgi:pyruvate dehydrogenase E2 component (dihydrolipoamide acetyltransferase)